LPIRTPPIARVARERLSPDAIAAMVSLRTDMRSDIDRLRRSSDGIVPGAVLDGLTHAIEHRLERTERRLLAGVKRREVEVMRQLGTARGSLFPHGVRQERKLASIPFLARYGQRLLDRMLADARTAERLVSDAPRFIARGRCRVGMTAVPGDSDATIVDVKPAAKTGGAAHVALGILVSRLFGIVRQMLTATFLGATGPADAFQAAFKVTNFLQNLFGEGALSASFIPVYSKLVKKDPEEAGRVAGAVGAILALAVSIIVLVGIVATPLLIPLIAQGFDHDRREMTIRLTDSLSGAGLFVISAWCLGILNTHGKFLLSISRRCSGTSR
jgi:hypothetical protein